MDPTDFTAARSAATSPGKAAATRIASSIAAIAAVCGAFYIGMLFSGGREANPPKNPKVVAATAPAETTGSAPRETQDNATETASGGSSATGAVDCQEQTWPYIARPCLANETRTRGVRVISTDNLADPVVSMVQSPPDELSNRPVAAPEPANTAAAVVSNNATAAKGATPLMSGAALGAITFSAAAKPEQVEAPPAAAPVQPEPVVQAALPATDPQPSAEKKTRREAAIEKSKRKAKRQEAERVRTVTVQSDDDDDDAAAVVTRNGKSRARVVERRGDRDYIVPSYDGNGTRRVIVIDGSSTERSVDSSDRGTDGRGGFPNIFGAMFGGGG